MSWQISPILTKELGLLVFRVKNKTVETEGTKQNMEPVATPPQQAAPILEKNELRLLVKILQSIGHECDYQAIKSDGDIHEYQHPAKTLRFDDVNLPDDDSTMHLAPLSAMIQQPQLKRPVWEKLKTLSA